MSKTHVRHKFEQADPLTWVQVHNILPIITFICGLIITFYVFKGNQEIIAQKQNYMEIQINKMQDEITQINRLLRGDIEGVSTSSANFRGR